MGFSHWFAVRQAREAIRAGQLDVARNLLKPFVQDGYRRAIALYGELAQAHLVRAERSLRVDDVDAAWHDLLRAEELNGTSTEAVRLRNTLLKLGVAACRAALLAGNPLKVLDTIAVLRERQAFHPDLDNFEEASKHWASAMEASDRGDFSTAFTLVDRGRTHLSDSIDAGLQTFRETLQVRYCRFAEQLQRLQNAATANDARSVLQAADDVLQLAPQHRDARRLKEKAWEYIERYLQSSHGNANSQDKPTQSLTGSTESSDQLEPVSPAFGALRRFVIWIDGVGGYLVCLSPRITLGQASANGPVDVPLFADVSRLHAEIVRDGEGYIFESAHENVLNGEAILKRSLIRPGDRVTLGATCQFVMSRPVPTNPSVRLDLVSGHRLPLYVDGILLMAENLIFGPGSQVHVSMPDVKSNVILYRSRDGIGMRYPGVFYVDNEPCKERANLPVPCHVSSDTFSFAIDVVGSKM